VANPEARDEPLGDRMTFLGGDIPPSVATTGQLGSAFERWVHQANKSAAAFVRGGGRDLGEFDGVTPPDLKGYYQRRANDLVANHGGVSLSSLEMRVPGDLRVFRDLPMTDPTPDGMFELADRGAVFESKLKDPSGDSLFLASMAAYALAAEKKTRRPYDYGILMHSGWPSGAIDAYPIFIDESSVSKVKRNLERLRSLVEVSWSIWMGRPRRRGTGSKPVSWEELLARPGPTAPSPPHDRFGPCGKCGFKSRCWRDNAWA
jgi:hypothetical protein